MMISTNDAFPLTLGAIAGVRAASQVIRIQLRFSDPQTWWATLKIMAIEFSYVLIICGMFRP